MINMLPRVLKALDANQALISLLGGESRIFRIQVPTKEADQFPRITYFEYNNIDSDYAEDEATASQVFIQVSVWAQDAAHLSPIAAEVDTTMRSLGFYRTSATDLYEDDTKVFHKALRYRGKFAKEELS